MCQRYWGETPGEGGGVGLALLRPHPGGPGAAAEGSKRAYLAEHFGALPGVHRAETEIVAQWIKWAGPLVASRA